MKRIEVHFQIISPSVSLDELTALIGINPSEGSYSRGEKRGRRTSDLTVWQLSSHTPDTAGFEEQFDDIASHLEHANILQEASLAKDCSFCLDVAVFYDGAMCVLTIPKRIIAWLGQHEIEVEVSCYPVSEW